jgi:Type II secretion system (T2SS), protein M subtype b
MMRWIRHPDIFRPAIIAAAGYVALCCALLGITLLSLVSAMNRADYRSEGAETTRSAPRPIAGGAALFLPGPSASIARAELLKRISTQITRLGGNIVSSSLDQSANPAQRIATVKTDFTIENVQLQRLLYELESATPFLFVDRLTVRSDPQSNTPYLLRIEMTVSGVWGEAGA